MKLRTRGGCEANATETEDWDITKADGARKAEREDLASYAPLIGRALRLGPSQAGNDGPEIDFA